MANNRNHRPALTVCMTFAVSVLLIGCAKKTPPNEKPQEQPAKTTVSEPAKAPTLTELEGTWVGSEMNDPQGVWTVKFTGNHFEMTGPEGKEWYTGPFLINPDETPKRSHLVCMESGDPNAVGKLVAGIYKIEADKLTVAATAPGSTTRPDSFEPTNGTRIWVLTKK